jgi:hypothetical protein
MFRKEAQRVIKARYAPIHLNDKSPYDCTENGWFISDSMSKDLFELQQKLSEYRRNYILKLTHTKRKEKLNKQLAKL